MNLPESARGERLDRAIAACLEGASVREVRRGLEVGQILVNGRRRAPGERAEGGEQIEPGTFVPRKSAVPVPDPGLASQVVVLHQDPHLLVLDKPSGVPSGPIRPGEAGTMLSAAIALDPAIGTAGPPLEGGLAHRLDTGTSGVLVFARDRPTWDALRADFRAHRVEKIYLALVHGECPPALVLNGAIGPGSSPERVRIHTEPEAPGAQAAHTEVSRRRSFPGGTLVQAVTRTGRRHQIRAHLAAAGLPIWGDPIYGPAPVALARLALHAARLTLPDGRSFESPLPEALAAVVAGGPT